MTTLAGSATAPPAVSLAERATLSRLVAVVTGKGGILKTSTICSIATAAARNGKKVLVVDVDSHGTASKRDMGLKDDPRYDNGESLANALMMTFAMGKPVAPTVVEKVVQYPSGGYVDVVAGGSELEGSIEAITAMSVTKERPYKHVLAKVLTTIASGYDLVLLDNDPKVKAIRLMVLEAAAFSYAPMDYDIAAYEDGLETLIDEMESARETNPTHFFLGAVAGRIPEPTIRAWRNIDKDENPRPGGAMVEINQTIQTILTDSVFDVERELLPGYPKLFDSMVRYAALNVAKARKAGLTINDYMRVVSQRDGGDDEKLMDDHQILRDYDELAAELIMGMVEVMVARRTR